MSSNERVRKLERELEATRQRLDDLVRAFEDVQTAMVFVGEQVDTGLDAAGRALGDVVEVIGFVLPPEIREKLPPDVAAALARLVDGVEDVPEEVPKTGEPPAAKVVH